MNKLLVLIAAVVTASSAMASKARLDALGGSWHLSDVQYIFESPEDINSLGDQATFEWGQATTRDAAAGGRFTLAKPHSEGGFVHTIGEHKIGFYLGRQSTTFNDTIGRAGDFIPGVDGKAWMFEENPFDVFYGSKFGDISYGAGFKYSKGERKSITKTATEGATASESMGVVVGATNGSWDVDLVQGISASSSVATTDGGAKIKSKSNTKLVGGYSFGNIYAYGSYWMSGDEYTDEKGAVAANVEGTDILIGMVNSMKRGGADFFYGLSYHSVARTNKTSGTKLEETTQMPVLIGLEAEVVSWLVARASVTQNILLGSTKAEGGEADSIADNTAVGAGFGLKFGKLAVDGVVNARTTGVLAPGESQFLTQASMTYAF